MCWYRTGARIEVLFVLLKNNPTLLFDLYPLYSFIWHTLWGERCYEPQTIHQWLVHAVIPRVQFHTFWSTQNSGGCYSHTSLRLQRVAWGAESALSSPRVCICTCMLNIESKGYLWRCMYRIFFFLVLILSTWNKIDDISIFVLYHMKLVPGYHFCLGGKLAVSFVETLML